MFIRLIAFVCVCVCAHHHHHPRGGEVAPPLVGAARDKARRRVMERNGSGIIRGQEVAFPTVLQFMPESHRHMRRNQRPRAQLPNIPKITVSADGTAAIYRDPADVYNDPDVFRGPRTGPITPLRDPATIYRDAIRDLAALTPEDGPSDFMEWVPARSVRAQETAEVPAVLAGLDKLLLDTAFEAVATGNFDNLLEPEGVHHKKTPKLKKIKKPFHKSSEEAGEEEE